MDSLVSVIVPVYKVEKYLDRCIESIVNQTYDKLEIILVDDGSPDNCPRLCDEWAERDNRIKVVHKCNGGLSSARNKGLDAASGKYIIFVDSDDWLELNAVEVLLSYSRYELVICSFISEYADHSEQCAMQALELEGNVCAQLLMDKLRPEAWCKLYRREQIDDFRFDETVRYAEDVPFNYEITKRVSSAVQIPDCLYHYNLANDSSITADFMTDARALYWQIYLPIIDAEKDNAENYSAALYRFCVSTFAVLSRVLRDEHFTAAYYNTIADAIVAFKKELLANKLIGRRHKLFIIVLSISKRLFKYIYKILSKVK